MIAAGEDPEDPEFLESMYIERLNGGLYVLQMIDLVYADLLSRRSAAIDGELQGRGIKALERRGGKVDNVRRVIEGIFVGTPVS